MKLSLSIFKKEKTYDYSNNNSIKIAVVDLDRSKKYPTNFVCILPKNIRANGERRTEFERTFGDESLQLAEKLLESSLKTEKDWTIKAEIRQRLELLNPEPNRNKRKNAISFPRY